MNLLTKIVNMAKNTTAPKGAKKVVEAKPAKKDKKIDGSPVAEAKLEKPIPDVVGKKFAGKELHSARWVGKDLVVRTVEQTEFKFSGKELDAFLAKYA